MLQFMPALCFEAVIILMYPEFKRMTLPHLFGIRMSLCVAFGCRAIECGHMYKLSGLLLRAHFGTHVHMYVHTLAGWARSNGPRDQGIPAAATAVTGAQLPAGSGLSRAGDPQVPFASRHCPGDEVPPCLASRLPFSTGLLCYSWVCNHGQLGLV